METKHLKKYAPEARRDFIAAVKNKAAVYGLLPKEILPMKEEGDVVIIGDRPFPRSVAKQRKELEARIHKEGFQQFIEAIAYTWFNRFVAIRYMELHGYLDHGYRVLSHPEGKATPEILENAERVELPGLKRDEVVDLKLDGGKDEHLYQMLLLAQCNALHKAMPFLFESIKDGTELLLPDNLLHTDSLVRTLVNGIPEEQWKNVEIIGWLYQFYISEKKDEVIGKVVKSEDIPAATQLFTPNWIVRYMLHNTLGRKWLATYPDSPLRQQMEFYIEPVEQTAKVKEQLNEITAQSLNPEELTLLDPACGSGHILVEAYDLFKSIYTERGYRARDIPHLILTKNLFGLEIDDRAAQLAAFSLLMKARADARNIFEQSVQPRILSIIESKGLDANEISESLNAALPDGSMGEISTADVSQLIALFEHGKTFGLLIQIPDGLATRLPNVLRRVEAVVARGDLFRSQQARTLHTLVSQATVLARSFDAVVANPPYMGNRYTPHSLKTFGQTVYPSASSDLFSMSLVRARVFAQTDGYIGFVCPYVWMFISTYCDFRAELEDSTTIQSLVQLEYNAFEPACVPVCTFTLLNTAITQFDGTFIKLSAFRGSDSQAPKTLEAINNDSCEWRYSASTDDFKMVPGAPIAYWATPSLRNIFSIPNNVGAVCEFTSMNKTADNNKYLRLWWEPSRNDIGEGQRWVVYAKGGPFRKWYGNLLFAVDWSESARLFYAQNKTSSLLHEAFWYREGITYSDVTSSSFSARYLPPGCVYDMAGPAFHTSEQISVLQMLALLNSPIADAVFTLLNPTLHYQVSDVKRLPIPSLSESKEITEKRIGRILELAKADWDSRETSIDFQRHPFLSCPKHLERVEDCFASWADEMAQRIAEMKSLEEENNRFVVQSYGVEGIETAVPEDNITLYRSDRNSDVKRLVSYAIGCMAGRYSLCEPGLVYAGEGNHEFKPERYTSFAADSDGVIPCTEVEWFDDDAANRFVEFVGKAWPKHRLEENLTFIAVSLGTKRGETTRESIRRYIATDFFKDHLQTYKGPKHPPRPIYWLFSSGSQRAFQCLVYLHRYHAGTLARVRTEYVVPLQGKIKARIEQIEGDIPAATSTSHRKKLEKGRDTLIRQIDELQKFDEKLRHYADQQIELDLNDGVKGNYSKFGDLLAEVKTVTG